jgi:hypothetical protein
VGTPGPSMGPAVNSGTSSASGATGTGVSASGAARR